MSHAEIVATPPEVAEPLEQPRFSNRIKKIATAAGLTAVAAVGSYIEFSDKTGSLYRPALEVVKSLRHPPMGYAFAWWINRKPRKHPIALTAAAVISGDLLVQTAEPAILTYNHDPLSPLSTLSSVAETTKDSAFSMGGGLFYGLQNRIWRNRTPQAGV